MEIVKVCYDGGLQTSATHLDSNYSIKTDAPKDNQGEGSSFSPTDLLCSSLASCCVTIMAIRARDRQWSLGKFEVIVSKKMTVNPRRVGKIGLSFRFENTFDKEQREVLEEAARTCPVFLSLHPDTKKELVFIYP